MKKFLAGIGEAFTKKKALERASETFEGFSAKVRPLVDKAAEGDDIMDSEKEAAVKLLHERFGNSYYVTPEQVHKAIANAFDKNSKQGNGAEVR